MIGSTSRKNSFSPVVNLKWLKTKKLQGGYPVKNLL